MVDQQADSNPDPKAAFLTPRSSYRGEFTPENLVFNANLQEFAQRVSLLCGLETGGKLTSDEAYEQIKQLWQQLKAAKSNLIDQERPPRPDLPPE